MHRRNNIQRGENMNQLQKDIKTALKWYRYLPQHIMRAEDVEAQSRLKQYSEEKYYDMQRNQIENFNRIYKEHGFQGIINEVEDRLRYGKVTETEPGLYRITTAGFSDDTFLLKDLIHILSMFGYNHYVGCLRGGAYYFTENKHEDNIKICKEEL